LRKNSHSVFSFDVSLAVVGEAILFLLRAQRWSGSRSQSPVSVVAALGSAESCCCCNHFRPGHNQQVALSNYHNFVSTTRIVLLFVRLAVALSTSSPDTAWDVNDVKYASLTTTLLRTSRNLKFVRVQLHYFATV
jgi:hypothetical protein